MMLKLKLFVGPNHTHQAQCPIPLEPLSGRPSPAGALLVVPPVAKETAAAKDAAAADTAAVNDTAAAPETAPAVAPAVPADSAAESAEA
jgi:large subunit ribosomal protein L13